MLDYYMLSFDHRTVVDNESLNVYKWVKVSPNQIQGGTAYQVVPEIYEGEVFSAVIDSKKTFLKPAGPGTLRTLTSTELIEYTIKKTLEDTIKNFNE